MAAFAWLVGLFSSACAGSGSTEGADCAEIACNESEIAAARQGMLPEAETVSALVLANVDNFAPIVGFHVELLRALPPDVTAYVLLSGPNPYLREFATQFAQKRFFAIDVANDSNWARDYVPEVVANGKKLSFVQFRYRGRPMAEAAGTSFAEMFRMPLVRSSLEIEGGNLMFDAGRLFVTDKVIARNAPKSPEEIEVELKNVLRAKEIHWMPRLPKETTGHVDIYAKIVGKNRVLVADSRNQERKATLASVSQTFEQLGYEVTRILNAERAEDNANSLTYTNSLLVNGTAFVPSYAGFGIDDRENRAIAKTDKAALDAYAALGFKAVPLSMLGIIEKGGAIHCLVKQLPAGTPMATIGP